MNSSKVSAIIALTLVVTGCATNSDFASNEVRGQDRIVYREIRSTVQPPKKVATSVSVANKPMKPVIVTPAETRKPVRVQTPTRQVVAVPITKRAVFTVPDSVEPSPVATTGNTYRVAPGDYLSLIASKHSFLGGSASQRLTAFYLTNQTAFENGNPDKLLKNSLLTVPSKQTILSSEPFYLVRKRLNY